MPWEPGGGGGTGIHRNRDTASMRIEVPEKISKGIPLGHLGQPDDIASSVRYIVENDYFTGRVLECDGGLRI